MSTCVCVNNSIYGGNDNVNIYNCKEKNKEDKNREIVKRW